MEWSWRTVLILIGLLAIAAIMIDGFRRMKRARAEALRLDIQPGMDELDDEDYNPELPGSVRVVSNAAVDDRPLENGTASTASVTAAAAAEAPVAERREPSFGDSDKADAPQTDDLKIGSALADSEDESPLDEPSQVSSQPAQPAAPPRVDIIPTVKPVDLNEKVPVLLDVEELGDERSFEEGIVSPARVISSEISQPEVKADRAPTTADVMPEAYQETGAQEQVATPDTSDSGSPESSSADSDDKAYYTELEDPEHIDDPHLDEEVENMPEETVISQPVNYAGANAEVLASRPDPELVLVIHMKLFQRLLQENFNRLKKS